KARHSGFLGAFTDDKKVNDELQKAVDQNEDLAKLNSTLKETGHEDLSAVIASLDKGPHQELAQGILMESATNEDGTPDVPKRLEGKAKAPAARLKDALGSVAIGTGMDPAKPLTGDASEVVKLLKDIPNDVMPGSDPPKSLRAMVIEEFNGSYGKNGT